MTSITPNTASCYPPGGATASGGGPVTDPLLDAGPTGSAPIGVAPTGPSDVPPPPGAGGELPGAGAPTGFDPSPADVTGGGGYVPAPAPVDVAGASGPAAVDPGTSTASITGGGPEAAATEEIITGGGPGAAPVPGAAAGPDAGQAMPGWNAAYGNAFASAFVDAGVDPATAAAALHSLAALNPTPEELEQTLTYLQTADGASLAPYMAEELAGQAPPYAQIGMDGGEFGALPGAATQLAPGQPTQGVDPTTGQPVGGAAGEPVPVGKLEDGSTQMSDGSIHFEDGTQITPDGNLLMPDGSTIAPDGTLTRADGSTGKIDLATGLEVDPATGQPIDPAAEQPIDPATGLPVDPAAAAAGEEAPPEEGGGGSAMPWIVGGTVAAGVVGTGIHALRKRNRAQPAEALPDPTVRAAATPAATRPAGAGAPRTDAAQVQELRERFRRNSAAGATGPDAVRPTPGRAATAMVEPQNVLDYRAAVKNNTGSTHGMMPRHGVRPGSISVADLLAREGVENVGRRVAGEAAEATGARVARHAAQSVVKALPKI